MSARTILVTGVTRGLGRELLLRFHALGHRVVGCGRSERAVSELDGLVGGAGACSALDVSSDEAVRQWAEEVLSRFGAPDLLINNAALINRNAPLWHATAEEFDRLMAVNVNGVVNVIRHFLPAMIERKRGVVVNMTSGWGRSTSPEVAPYCASKWALEGLTQALAQELPPGLAAIPVNPGVIHTAMLESCFGDEARGYPGPGDWADRAVPFLLKLGERENGRPVSIG